jgi:hypothetical protein
MLVDLVIFVDGLENGTVVQLVRAPPCHGGSCGFEPRQSRVNRTNLRKPISKLTIHCRL